MSARKLLRNPHGQSIIEITLITPLLLAALYVAMDFGILFLTAHYTQNAAREASRIGAIMPDCAIDATVPCVGTGTVTQSCPGTATVVQEACTRLPQALTGASVTVTLTGLYYPATCLREVKVTANGTYNYGFYRAMALMGFPVSPTTSVARSADARYQGQPVTVAGTCS